MRARSLCLPFAIIAAAALVAPASSLAATLTVPVQADTFADEGNRTRNFGTARELKLRAQTGNRRQAYLRFAVSGLSGTVQRATLSLRSLKSGRGLTVVPTSSTWGETTLTWNNAPALSTSPSASLGSFSSGRTLSVDVTSMVSGNGTFGLGVRATSDTTELASRERGTTTRPALVIEYTPITTPTSTAAPAIEGLALTGERLTATTGTWTGAPTSYGHRWRRCDSTGAACEDIAGATFAAHNVNDDDKGHTLRVIVTATNASGSASATSPATDVVRDPMIMAAGDIACSDVSRSAACREMDTSDVLVANDPDAVLPLGDTQYECGELSDFQTFYEKSWGRVKDVTHPAVGNHEYTSSLDPLNHCYRCPGRAGLLPVLRRRGHAAGPRVHVRLQGLLLVRHRQLASDRAELELRAQDANCALGSGAARLAGCRPGGEPQPLHAGLLPPPALQLRAIGNAAEPGRHVLHAARSRRGPRARRPRPHYERFAPMAPGGNPGSRTRRPDVRRRDRRAQRHLVRGVKPGSEVRDAKAFGVLRLDLRSSGYRWEFVR